MAVIAQSRWTGYHKSRRRRPKTRQIGSTTSVWLVGISSGEFTYLYTGRYDLVEDCSMSDSFRMRKTIS